MSIYNTVYSKRWAIQSIVPLAILSFITCTLVVSMTTGAGSFMPNICTSILFTNILIPITTPSMICTDTTLLLKKTNMHVSQWKLRTSADYDTLQIPTSYRHLPYFNTTTGIPTLHRPHQQALQHIYTNDLNSLTIHTLLNLTPEEPLSPLSLIFTSTATSTTTTGTSAAVNAGVREGKRVVQRSRVTMPNNTLMVIIVGARKCVFTMLHICSQLLIHQYEAYM